MMSKYVVLSSVIFLSLFAFECMQHQGIDENECGSAFAKTRVKAAQEPITVIISRWTVMGFKSIFVSTDVVEMLRADITRNIAELEFVRHYQQLSFMIHAAQNYVAQSLF